MHNARTVADSSKRSPSPPVKLKLRINFQSLALYPQRKTHTALLPLPPPWSIEDIGAAFVVKDARAAKSSAITRNCLKPGEAA